MQIKVLIVPFYNRTRVVIVGGNGNRDRLRVCWSVREGVGRTYAVRVGGYVDGLRLGGSGPLGLCDGDVGTGWI